MLNWAPRVKQVIFICLFIVNLSLAQSQLASLSINGELYNEVGSFYFKEFGNTKDAYAKAAALAKALGLEYKLNAENQTLTFLQGDNILTLKSTKDVEAGLVKSTNLLINGESKDSPMAILVDDDAYVAISPVIAALGGESDFDYHENTLKVAYRYHPQTPTTPDPSELAPPRIGYQDGGVTRVVIDLPPESPYELSVAEHTMIVKLPGLRSAAYFDTLEDDANIKTLQYGTVDNTFALVITTQYPLSASGEGFQTGLLAANDSNPYERLFIDFASHLKGAEVKLAINLEISSEIPEARAPTASQKVVVIDPGHGGKFAGAQGYAAEEAVVLAISLNLAALLEQQGITVILTRDGDYALSQNYQEDLSKRSDFAKPDTNLFISIHANAAGDSRAHGIETWVFGKPLEDSSLALAIKENGGGEQGAALTQEALDFTNSVAYQIYQQEQLRYSLSLAEAVQNKMVEATNARDRGIAQNALYVIRKARTAAILVEVGFVSNPDEGAKLASSSYQATLAQALASGIIDFLNQGGLVAIQP